MDKKISPMTPDKKCRKCVLILLDGLGDRAYAELDHRTPLEAARTPALDALAAEGANGLYHAAEPGLALPSETAHFAMFGYGTAEFPGRGALEALGAGIPLRPEDVAVLGHFSSVAEKQGRLLLGDTAVPCAGEEEKALFSAVSAFEHKGIMVRFHQTGGRFGIITLHGEVAPFITDSDPILEGQPLSEIKPWSDHGRNPLAVDTAAALKAYLVWAYHRLREHPVNLARKKRDLPLINAVVTQRAGQLKSVPFFRERYGLSGVSVASGGVYRGLCAYLGLDFREVPDTGDPRADMAARLAVARELLGRYEFIHVHTKTPDQAGHTKDVSAKRRVIEQLDLGIGETLGPLRDDPNVMLILTADHSTPSAGPLVHSGEPVPLTFHGTGVRRDRVAKFNEIDAAAGLLGHIRGRELMYMVLNHLDRVKLRGLMDTPVDQCYWPGDYEPFRLP